MQEEIENIRHALSVRLGVAIITAFDGPFVPRCSAMGWRSHKHALVNRHLPLFWVPDFKSIPWLPHPDDLSGRRVNPDVVRSLRPVVYLHRFLDEFDEKVLPAYEAHIHTSSRWVHEVVSDWIDLDT